MLIQGGPKVSLHTLGLIPTLCFILEGCCFADGGGEPMGKNGEKWGKMGKEFYGESILGLAIFPIFPHFSPFFSIEMK